jgi:hypothetical protein
MNAQRWILLYSCDIVERRTNLMISTSHGLLNLQATIPSAIFRFVMLLLCQFPSLSVHDPAGFVFVLIFIQDLD